MKNMKTTALPKLGRDDRREPMSRRILGNALTDLRGLSTLIVLSPFRLGIFGMNSMMPMHTTEKSIQFQGSRRYEFL